MTDSEKLDKILEWMAAHDAHHETVGRDLIEVRASLYGNGHPGIVSRTQTIEQRCASQCVGAIARSFLKIAENVASAAIIAFIAWLAGIWKLHP